MGRRDRRELAALHWLIGGVSGSTWLGGAGLERVIPEGFEDVVAAFEQLARQGEACAVAADPFGELELVGAVGLEGNRAR